MSDRPQCLQDSCVFVPFCWAARFETCGSVALALHLSLYLARTHTNTQIILKVLLIVYSS